MSGRVRVEPLGVVFDVTEGESLMAAAQRLGYYWPTVCHGNAQCNRCVLRVIDGAGLEAMMPTERSGLESVRWRHEVDLSERLACQVRVCGDAVVEKRGVRPPAYASR